MPIADEWIVTTSADRPLTAVATDLTAAGFRVDQTLEEIGVIIGRAERRILPVIRAITGVSDVAPNEPVDIGPPDDAE